MKKSTLLKISVIFTAIVITISAIISVVFWLTARNQGGSFRRQQGGKEYRNFTLNNGIKVILVRDPNATESAFALNVAAGCMHEDKKMPGVAHLLEHLVFETEILEFVTAFDVKTRLDYTLFPYKLPHSKLEELVKRTADRISNPSFSIEKIKSEIAAIQSESVMRGNDFLRMEMVNMATAKEGHPYTSAFLIGNEKTFGTNMTKILANLRNFHKSFYTGNYMTLAILSKHDLDHLEKVTRESFNQIPAGNNTPLPTFGSPYGQEELGVKVHVDSASGERILRMEFPVIELKSISQQQRNLEYYAKLVSHPGKGQLYNFLLTKRWIIFMVANINKKFRGFYTITFTLQLTELGLDFHDHVVQSTFEYLALLKQAGPQKWFWDEISEVANATNKLKMPNDAMVFVELVASKLTESSFEETIATIEGNEEQPQFSAHELEEMINIFKPANMRLFLLAKLNKESNVRSEPFYGTPYKLERIKNSTRKQLENAKSSSTFNLPKANEYFPKAFDSASNNTKAADASKTFQLSTLDKLPTTKEFNVLTATFLIQIYSSVSSDFFLNYWILSMIEKNNFELIQLASAAGFKVETKFDDSALMVTVEGLSNGIDKVVLEFMKSLTNFDPSDEFVFQMDKEEYQQLLKTSRHFSTPCDHYSVEKMLDPEEISFEEELKKIENLRVEAIADYFKKFISRLKFRWTFSGNISQQHAKDIVLSSEQYFLTRGTLLMMDKEKHKDNVTKIPKGTSWLYRTCIESVFPFSSCTRVMLQVSKDNRTEAVMTTLLSAMMKKPFFQQMRVEEGLGYVANSVSRLDFEILALEVQGEWDPAFVNTRINHFIENFMDNSSYKLFQEHKTVLLERFAAQPMYLEILKKIQFEDFRQFYEEFTGLKHGRERRLTLHFSRGVCLEEDCGVTAVISKNAEAERGSGNSYNYPLFISNLTQWKEDLLH